MLDKVVLQIPFSKSWIESGQSDTPEFHEKDPFSRDVNVSFEPKYLPFELSKGAKFVDFSTGTAKCEDIYCPWESVESSHSGLAMKVYHEGNGYAKWPYVEIKCSPAKLIQGHNVFGFDDLKKSVSNMLWLLNNKYPEFFAGHEILEERGPLLDFDNIRVAELDITYSISVPEKKVRLAVVDFISNISKGQTKKSGDKYVGTAYFGSKNSRTKKIKVYDKSSELEHDTKKRKKANKTVADESVKVLASTLLRFEATVKKEWFERQNIPTKLSDLCQYIHDYENDLLAYKCTHLNIKDVESVDRCGKINTYQMCLDCAETHECFHKKTKLVKQVVKSDCKQIQYEKKIRVCTCCGTQVSKPKKNRSDHAIRGQKKIQKSFYKAVFARATKDLFEAMVGQEIAIMRDDEVYKHIDTYCCDTRGKTNRVFSTYKTIKTFGLDKIKRDGIWPDRTFYRLVRELQECGFSKVQIDNLHCDSPVLVSVPKFVSLENLFEPVPEDHVFVDLWDQAA